MDEVEELTSGLGVAEVLMEDTKSDGLQVVLSAECKNSSAGASSWTMND